MPIALNVSAMNLAFSSLVLLPSVTWISSHTLARPCSASERPPANQSSGSTRWTMIAVTFGSLLRKVADRRLTSAAMAAFEASRLSWLANVTVMRGMANLHC